MEYIFDQQRPYDGIFKGGAGKLQMYASRDSELRQVEFTCKPFNDLFWGLWVLFARYLRKRQGADLEGEPGEYSFELSARIPMKASDVTQSLRCHHWK
jgi:hypothetical protein